MSSENKAHSMSVIETVAKALGEDPMDLPPLEATISADALDALFHEGNEPDGAYTVFPYSGLWVLVHSTGTIDVFDEFRATNRADNLPDGIEDPSTDDQILFLHDEGNRYALSGGELDDIHTLIDEADNSDEAWGQTIEYAQQRTDD